MLEMLDSLEALLEVLIEGIEALDSPLLLEDELPPGESASPNTLINDR
jgi:hypothetical protein